MHANGKLRGWLRASRRHSAETQREALIDAGASVVYDASQTTIESFIAALRKPKKGASGDVVLVTSLGRLANRREGITEAVRAIHKVGAVVLETSTGRSSNDAANILEMLDEALDELRADRRTHSKARAKELGKLGGKARAAQAEADRTSIADALVAWRDLKLTTAEALDTGYMRGWTSSTAYRVLKSRNTHSGSKIGRPKSKV
mgnify:CR=1 FL=1